MRLPGIAIRNYQFTIVIVVLLVAAGVMSLVRMPKSEDPQVSKAGASVIVIYPGAAPEDIEQLVVEPIEDVLNELDDIKKIESTCRDSLATVGIEFLSGSDPDEKFADVNEKINSVRQQLPADILSLDTRKWSVADTNFIQFALISDTPQPDYRELEKQAEQLEKLLKKISGVKKAESWAFPQQEVRISLDLTRMAMLGIPLNRVMGSIQSANMNIPGGTIDAGTKRFAIQTSGSYESIDEIRETVVHSEGTKVVYLKDIADVSLTYEDNNYYARCNGKDAVFVTANQKEGSNIYDITDELWTAVARFKANLPSTIRLEIVYNQVESVTERLNLFGSNLVQGIILVGIVILIAIGLRGSMIVMMAIPMSLLMGISFLDRSGYGLQQISIGGLVLTLGLLVDNAIVVVENISRFIKKGETNVQAAIKGTSQIGWAITSATVTTVLAFFPLTMMRDVSGDFMRSMPLTVIYTLTASLFIALTFTPFLAQKFLLSSGKSRKSNLMQFFDRFIENHYRKWLTFALRKPFLIVAFAIFIFACSLVLFTFVGISFFPDSEKPQFFIDVNLPEGSTIHETDKVVQYVETQLAKRPGVVYVAANIGRGNPQIYYNVIGRYRQSNTAQLFVKLDKATERETTIRLINELRDTFTRYPGARIELKGLDQGPPVKAPVEIKVRGEKIEVLEKIAGDVEKLFAATPGLININNPMDTAKTDIRVKINREKAAMYGIPLVEIDRTIRMSIAGVALSQYRDKEGKEYNITLRAAYGDEAQPKLDIFSKIYLTTATGALIPLNQVARIELKSSSTRIDHFNLDRSATITADVAPGISTAEITEEVIRKLEGYLWPVGYDYYVGGEKEGRERAFGGLEDAVLIAIIAIFAVLVLQFKSFTQPLIVYAALPLAIIGSIIALLITGNTFSFTAFIGLTSLVGIVVNNSIILVDYTNQLRAEGKSTEEAVKEAGETRFLPILLTTLTTIGGMLPLTLRGGTLWAPLGWTIIGGLITSTFLTLIIVPVLYKMFTTKQRPHAHH